MTDKKNITKDIACAIVIIKELTNRPLKYIVSKDNLLSKETFVFIGKTTFNRAIRELIRLRVLERIQNGYKVNYDNIENAVYKLNNYDKNYLSLNEIEDRLKSSTVLTREEINNILPELTIPQIDNLILNLLSSGFLTKYGESSSRGMYVISSKRENIYIPDVLGKLFQIYNDIIICYNTALEYYDLSRYATSRIIYIEGKTRTEKNIIFSKQIKEVRLKNPEIGISFIEKGNIKITDKERTIIDCIRFPKYALGWENIFHAIKRLKSLDEEKLLEYIIKFKTPTLTSKIGVIFENYNSILELSPRFFSSLNLYKSNTPFRLIRGYPGILDKHWNIYIPKNFFKND